MEEDYKLAKWLNDELTAIELAEFKQDPDYALYKKIKEESAHLKTPDFDEVKMLAHIVATEKAPKKVVFLQNWFVRIAAVLVIGLGLFFALNIASTATQLAENGKTATFLLPDNSEVVLNSDSKIIYKKWFWNSNRKLELKGEAYFKVTKGKKFEVNTDLGKVTVLGTQFNVNSKANKFEVTCFEGKVKVNYKHQEVILTKGMVVVFENDSKAEGKTTLVAPNWETDAQELKFEKVSLQTVITEIEKQYAISIRTQNNNSNQLFTGKIPGNNLDIALEIIASTYHLKIRKLSEVNFELVKK